MKHTDTVIIGGGQAGLAMSRCLTERRIDHVVLERGRVGERWRSERWDSLRLLSPNWMARLPHYRYEGDDPEGFMTMGEYIRYLDGYAASFEAPVRTGTDVRSVSRNEDDRYIVRTDRGDWNARSVVVATGFCDVPRVPALASDLSPRVFQMTPPDYRHPGQLPAGNVLVVGASATGLQIAEELLEDGRKVTLAVGRHVRLPRRYRGRDILEWLVAMGGFDAPANPADERASPPPQLIGTPSPRDLDLGVLMARGARLVGRAIGAQDEGVRFADDLQATVETADQAMREMLSKVDGYIKAEKELAPPPEPFRAIAVPPASTRIDLRQEGINSVIWATGYERRYPWLEVPVLDGHGEIRHERGVCPVAGLYVLGMRFQATKGSNLIDGVGADAEFLADHLAQRSANRAAA